MVTEYNEYYPNDPLYVYGCQHSFYILLQVDKGSKVICK
mgnify:CR=1 FL=1